MKAIRIFLTSVITLTLSSFCALAQMQRPPMPKGESPHREQLKFTPKERATQRTEEMHKAVKLDEKQYKKIYKIFISEENAKQTAMESGPMGPPPGGFPGGAPPQGGGFPSGGFPGGPGMSGPPSGMPFPGGFGEPQKPTVNGKPIDSDEYIDAREAKFKKILSPEQYATWRRLHPDPSGFFTK